MPCLNPPASGTPPPHEKIAVPDGFDALKLLRPPLRRPAIARPSAAADAEPSGMEEDALMFVLAAAMLVPAVAAFAGLLTWTWFW